MSTFIQLHLLTNYAPSNLNRDDLGRPKTAKMGGVDRLRISSQSLKRAWRCSDVFKESLEESIGVRSRKMGEEIFKILTEDKNVDEKIAKAWTIEILKPFGKIETKESKDLYLKQLVHVSPEEWNRVLKLIDKLTPANPLPKKEAEELLKTETSKLLTLENQAVDISMFGRMLADAPKYNVEAAVQVAHAITVNKVVIEDDYFTAVDDLNNNDIDAGSGHIGESGFGSGVFYTYICVNKTQLIENLKDESLANKAIESLVKAATTVSPGGKQNSFASRARALYMLAEKGTQQPRQLSSAFLKPVDSPDMVDEAVKRLETLRDNMDKAYGKCADEYKSMNIETGEGTLAQIISFVGE